MGKEGYMEPVRDLPGSFLETRQLGRYYPPDGVLGASRPTLHHGPDQKSLSRWEWKTPQFDFVDLFAGIGGLRIAFESVGGRCVFSSEWDAKAQETYVTNFGERPHGDITKIKGEDIPAHRILVGGFPCQPFSIAGVSKKKSLGREHGFKDVTQGNLFFDIVRLLAHHAPDAFVLENVKNLRSHDSGRTYAVIITKLRQLGYHVFDKIIDARSLVPQHRERIFIVGFREFRPFDFPELPAVGPKFQSILDRKAPDKYFLSPHLWNYLQRYAEKHRAKGNGFGFGLTPKDGVARTLSARYYKDGSEILIDEGRPTPRRLTPRECASLMGFPEDFKIVVADTPAYKQFGNSVVVPVAKAVAQCVVKALGLQGRARRRAPSPQPGAVKLA